MIKMEIVASHHKPHNFEYLAKAPGSISLQKGIDDMVVPHYVTGNLHQISFTCIVELFRADLMALVMLMVVLITLVAAHEINCK